MDSIRMSVLSATTSMMTVSHHSAHHSLSRSLDYQHWFSNAGFGPYHSHLQLSACRYHLFSSHLLLNSCRSLSAHSDETYLNFSPSRIGCLSINTCRSIRHTLSTTGVITAGATLRHRVLLGHPSTRGMGQTRLVELV